MPPSPLHHPTGVLLAQAAVSCPKPVKAPKHSHQWRRGVNSICLVCGKKKPDKSGRSLAKHQLYEILSKLVRWRDGGCVLKETDGQHCSGYDTDSHILPRGEYGVTFDLLNNHDGCQGHNKLHNSKPSIYYSWFWNTFGIEAWEHLNEKACYGKTEKSMTTDEIREMVKKYQELWDTRPASYTREDLIRLGYFGEWMQARLAAVTE